MAGPARYEVRPPWHPTTQWSVYWNGNDDEYRATVTIETAALYDRRTGDVYPSGAHRVVIGGRKPPGFRGKTFRGETAWCEAEAYANNVVSTIRMTRESGR